MLKLGVLLVVTGNASAMPLGRPAKRQNNWYTPVADAATQVLSHAAELLHISTPAHIYHSDTPAAKDALIDALWGSAWIEGITDRFSVANPALTFLFEKQRVDEAEDPTRFLSLQGRSRWEAAIAELFRARSQKWIPIETAATSIMWLYYRVPQPAWDTVRYFTRSVMCSTWTEDLCDLAVKRDPGAPYPVVQGITSAVFDNLMMKVAYSSFAANGESGTKIEMTNWASVLLPASTMPSTFQGIDAILGAGGIFKPLLNMDDFLDGFSMYAEDIVKNQRARWSKFLNWASLSQDIWDDTPFDSPYPPTKFHFHDPIFDRLQSSYEDVNYELDHMRRSYFHKFSDALQLGGDGLSYMRLIDRLSQDPRRFLETKPIIIPRMGENPHGLFHIMHGDWRIWAPLLLKLAAVVNNRQVKADPTVADFNKHQHFLRVVVQALSEYVVEISIISKTGTDFNLVVPFMRDAERNLSFAYVVFFPIRLRVQVPRLPALGSAQRFQATRSVVARESCQHSCRSSQQSQLQKDVGSSSVLGSCSRGTVANILPQFTHNSLGSLTRGLGHANREAQLWIKESVLLYQISPRVANLSVHFAPQLHAACLACCDAPGPWKSQARHCHSKGCGG